MLAVQKISAFKQISPAILVALVIGGCSSIPGTSYSTYGAPSYQQTAPAPVRPAVPARYQRQIVEWNGDEAYGTVVVDTQQRFLYLVQGDKAIRYGVGVGRDGFRWQGEASVGRKAEWPTWTPPKEMIEREPTLIEYESGMPGGIDNPLGARALYLYSGGKDTLYRLHGTNEPWTIGQAVSSGCIRLQNDDIADLYSRVPVGAQVIVI